MIPPFALQKLLKNNAISNILKKGSNHHPEVMLFQKALYCLGYGTSLKWEQFGPDGYYGNATCAAVQQFIEKNQLIETSNEVISPQLADVVLKQIRLLDAIQKLTVLINKDQVATQLKRDSKNGNVKALQYLLHHLGFDEELKWDLYGADGDYGQYTANAVKALAHRIHTTLESTDTPTPPTIEIATNGNAIDHTLLAETIAHLELPFEDGWKEVPYLCLEESDQTARVWNAETQRTLPKVRYKSRRGIRDRGDMSPSKRIDKSKDYFIHTLGFSESVLEVLKIVAANEGNLDAINCYDNSFLSFGMYQWTLGTRSNEGELAALLKKIKTHQPAAYTQCFGQFGIQPSASTGTTYGYLNYHNNTISKIWEKEQCRSPFWAFRFWNAGQHKEVQEIEILHALDRMKNFFWRANTIAGTYSAAQLVSSEYGVCLLLDNHINRPRYVLECLSKAFNQVGLGNPRQWGIAEEQQLLNAYLEIRKTYGTDPMTHADIRARKAKQAMRAGLLSQERDSFSYEKDGSRSPFTIGTPPPENFDQAAYPEIRQEELE